MNPIFLTIIFVPVIEIYLLIKIGSEIGAITTIFLIFITAILGIYYAKYEGLNTLRSGFNQLKRNETPTYEMLSGAAIAFAAVLLIIPGFATDLLGFLLIFPLTRKFIFNGLFKKFNTVNTRKSDFIDGEYEDLDEKDDR
ncbi:FxsA family protein [Candidatus Pelagibacter sp.]|uniref:FxsA family protein n=1 Tax=Candidatus Pelagibacter sp. TaxID=2024849 RepID=UPI003F84D60F